MRAFPCLMLCSLLFGCLIAPSALAQSVPLPIAVAQRRQGDFLRELNLSPRQTQQIQVIRNRYQEPMAQRKQALRQAQQELRSLMAGNATDDQLRQQFQQTQTIRQDLAELQFNSLLEIRATLTPDQRRRLADLMGDRRP